MSTGKSTAWVASRMVERFGMHVIPLQSQSKLPVKNDWGNNAFSSADDAREYFEHHTLHNLGVALGPSRLCSLDIDCLDSIAVQINRARCVRPCEDQPECHTSA